MFEATLTYLGHLFIQLGPLEWLLVLMLTGVTYMLWHAQYEDDSFDLRHLVVDPSTGKIVLEKFAMLGAFVFSSWGFVALVVKGTLSEWYFIGYMAAWAATRTLSGWIQSKKGPSDEAPK